MKGRVAWLALGLLILAGGFWYMRGAHGPGGKATSLSGQLPAPAAGHPGTIATTVSNTSTVLTPGQGLKYRLSNTTKKADDLLRNDRAILLANAVIDTTRPLDALNIPDNLKAPPDNGSWVVQARGPLDASFRALLAGAGAQVISYIPNNAELVLASDNVAGQLRASPLVSSVLPYEPYYKLTDPQLLKAAVTVGDLPADVGVRVGVFTGSENATLAALKKLGADVVGSEPSPFGTTYNVHLANGTFIDAVRLPGVMVMEAMHRRFSANDLSRMRLGASVNTTTNIDYLSLTGLGVFLNVNDSDVDISHPDLSGRITLDPTATGADPNGHGTHVIGTILGNGSQSGTVGTNAQGSVTNASFRGMATNATAYFIGLGFNPLPQSVFGAPLSDAYLQETAGRTNVFISNNSWDYDGDASYDMAAASYDASVRDAVPELTGPQPLLYVFSAGNSGSGGTDGSGGIADTILSPATAKNVITVGAVEQLRKITNKYVVHGVTNQAWLVQTDNSNQVASFSSRGNVGVGIEGPSGRFKPDVVAPGTFVLSDKASQWNQGAYYNPTNFTVNTQFNQSVTNNGLAAYSIIIPANAVAFTVNVVTNDFSPTPFPALPVYVRFADNPTTNTFDATGAGTVTLTKTGTPALPVGSRIFYSVGDQTNGFVSFDVETIVATTNDNGNLLTVQSNMNAKLGPWYRYESGTSMSAAGVSGILALMQEFLERRLNLTTHSPALMKALLINGARTLGSQYDFNVTGAVTSEGWGLPSLTNSIPGALTNGGANVAMQFFDQTTNLLATGQGKTRTLTLAKGLGTQPLRVTLVWTDPPGNPAAGVKLVNDLDLIVTNLDNNTVFYGNDIPAGSAFNVARSVTNNPTNFDSVNNVENVYLFPPLGTNYSITVYGRRVNVNAVDANTNDVVQDYALVVSYGDGGVFSNAFAINDTAAVVSSNNTAGLTTVTNGLPLLNQRVGGNSQFAWVPGSATNGIANQWKFFIFTNTPSLTNTAFTNVAFVTFDPPNLGVPRMGTREEANPDNGVRTEADIDLYVSTDPNLLNLVPAVVDAAFHSQSRTGTEKVLLSNQPQGGVYYVGVKSEDQEGAQFAFVGVALTNSFGQVDSNGNVTLTILAPALPTSIPGGTPAHPGSVTVLALTTANVQARKVVVEDTIQHQEFGDLVGEVSHTQKAVVLNNHSFFDNLGDQTETFLYDDTGEVGDTFLTQPPFSLASPLPANPQVPRHSDGPGSLTSFTGDNISDGIWTFSMVNDSSPNDTGFINNLNIFVEPQQPTNGFDATIAADSWFYDFVDVPASATNVTFTVGLSTPGPVDFYVRRGAFPDAGDFDKFAQFTAPGGVMTLGLFDSPPLNAGRYFIGVFNPTPTPQTVHVRWTFGLSLAAPQPLVVLSAGNEPIPDDAVMDSTNHVGQKSKVVSVEAGVRIVHPRESDLVLTLVSPSGTRVLLAENRGGLDGSGYGSGTDTTNFVSTVTAGSFQGDTNVIPVGTNSGTLLINYNMFSVPDDLRVYYGGTRIFDSGLISGAGNFVIDFGPGAATSVTVVMNELGTNPNGTNGDAWTYQVTEITKGITYATFTEDTNKTTMPIKFAVPPFGGGAAFTPAITVMQSSFEPVAAGDYATPSVIDGWSVVDTNPVKVVTVTALAANEVNGLQGVQVLALHHGSILRALPTVAGQSYTLSFVNHGRPTAGPYNSQGPAGWWKGDGTPNDSSGNGNLGILNGGLGYTNGEVAQGFNYDLTNGYLSATASPTLTVGPNAGLTVECWINTADLINARPMFEWNKNTGVDTDIGTHFWINTPVAGLGGGPGCLFANLKNPAGNFIFSTAGGIVTGGAFQHAALTYDRGSGVARIYYNGVLEAQANAPFAGYVPGTSTELDIGARVASPIDPFGQPGTVFDGVIDEPTVYSNALSQLQVQDIYAAGSAGKLPATLIGSNMMVAANVILAGQTNLVFTGIDQWTTNIITFTAPSNNTVVEIQSITNNDGMLVDSFQLVANPAPNTNNFYLPEETLNALVGEPAQGDWKLEVLDNRLGATNPQPTLVSWQLSLGLERVNPAAQILSNAIPVTNTVLPGFISYFVVDVPPWAQFATNILNVTSGGGPAGVSLLFNQSALPGLTNGDFQLIAPTLTGGTFTLSGGSTPPLVSGAPYYLAVTNSGATAATFTLEVDFGDITPLTNLVPVTSTMQPINTQPRYFLFDVPPGTPAVSFLLYNLSGDVNLYVTKGFPLPTTTSFNYDSINPGTNDDIITIAPNSQPVPLSAGRWYLSVFNNDVAPVNYTIEAVDLAATVIALTNDVPYSMTNVTPLASQETFFYLYITNAPAGALFELYGLSGNVDLDLNYNTFPYAPAFFATSTNPGTNDEQIVIRTNTTGPANLNGFWFLGAPNQSSSNVTYTIHAVVTDTNGLLVSAVPIQPVVALPVNPATGPTLTWNTVTGECYDVYSSPDLITWTLLPIFPMPVNAGGPTITVTDPTPITGIPARFYKIVQVVCP